MKIGYLFLFTALSLLFFAHLLMGGLGEYRALTEGQLVNLTVLETYCSKNNSRAWVMYKGKKHGLLIARASCVSGEYASGKAIEAYYLRDNGVLVYAKNEPRIIIGVSIFAIISLIVLFLNELYKSRIKVR